MASAFSSSYNVSLFVCYSESCSVLIHGYLGISKFNTSDRVSLLYVMHNRITLHFNGSQHSPYKLLLSTISNCF